MLAFSNMLSEHNGYNGLLFTSNSHFMAPPWSRCCTDDNNTDILDLWNCIRVALLQNLTQTQKCMVSKVYIVYNGHQINSKSGHKMTREVQNRMNN